MREGDRGETSKLINSKPVLKPHLEAKTSHGSQHFAFPSLRDTFTTFVSSFTPSHTPNSSPSSSPNHYSKAKAEAEEKIKLQLLDDYPILKNDALSDLYAECKALLKRTKEEIKKRGEEEKHVQLSQLKSSLEVLKDALILDQQKKLQLIKDLINYDDTQRRGAVNTFFLEQNSVIERRKQSLALIKLNLTEELQLVFYNDLKQIIINPFWQTQVKKYGGKIIVDGDEEKRVPTGLEGMMRIVWNIPLPMKKSFCYTCMFCVPAQHLRVPDAEFNESEPAVIKKKIEGFKSIAAERLNTRTKRLDDVSKFYNALISFNLDDLKDYDKLSLDRDQMEQFNGRISETNFVKNDEIPLSPVPVTRQPSTEVFKITGV